MRVRVPVCACVHACALCPPFFSSTAAGLSFKRGYVFMLRWETKTLEQGIQAGSQGECALMRVRGLWRCAPFCAPSKQDRKLVTEPVKLAGLCN